MTTRSHKSNGKSNGNGNAIKVRDNVPIPPITRKRKCKYHLDVLRQPGQSFHIPASWNLSAFRATANRYAKINGMKITVRREEDQPGHGIWRLK